MHTLKLAYRNILRNRRRTLATVSAVMISCAGLLLFAGYVTWAHQGGESHSVTQVGHIQVFRKGFYERGAGNPSAFVIDGYDQLKKMLLEDEVLKSRLDLVTGQLLITGMVSSSSQQTSTPFVGLGVFPAEHQHLIDWNPYGIYPPRRLAINRDILQEGAELDAANENAGSLGVGLAKILQISMKTDPAANFAEQSGGKVFEPLHDKASESDAIIPGLSLEPSAKPAPQKSAGPTVELLSMPPTGGTPNMMSLGIRRICSRATKEMDDRLVKMPVSFASSLVFPGEEIKVTAIVLLLHDTDDVPLVTARLQRLIVERGLDLEMKNWIELVPDYKRSMEMLDMFFVFTLCVVGVVLVFTIFNTIHMGVIERTCEIGTIRAIGMTQSGVLKGFLLEGLLLGIIGAGLGVLLGIAVAAAIYSVEIVYQPPVVPYFTKLEVFVVQNPLMMGLCFLGCLLVALLASIPAARRASRMSIAEALRH